MAQDNNSEKRRFGRRATFGGIAIALITIAFYITLFRGAEIEWFWRYATCVVGIYGFIVSGLTLTDIWGGKIMKQ